MHMYRGEGGYWLSLPHNLVMIEVNCFDKHSSQLLHVHWTNRG